MAGTTCLVCLLSTVSGCCKITIGRDSASSGYIAKLEQSTFLDIYGTKQASATYFLLCLWFSSQAPIIVL